MFCRFTCTSWPTWKMSSFSCARRVISSRRPPSIVSIGGQPPRPPSRASARSVTVFGLAREIGAERGSSSRAPISMKSSAVATSSDCASEGGIAFAFSTGATSVRARRAPRGCRALRQRARRAPASTSACLPNGSSAARLPDVYLSQVSFCWAVSSRSSRSERVQGSSSSRVAAQRVGHGDELLEAVGVLQHARCAPTPGRARADGEQQVAEDALGDLGRAVDELLHLLVDLGEERLRRRRPTSRPPKTSASKNAAAAVQNGRLAVAGLQRLDRA